jgi:multidrug efflux pump subunit AcrB
MRNKILTWVFSVFLVACSNDQVSLHPTPLVINARFNFSNASPDYIEKYFLNPMAKAFKSVSHISATHTIATTNTATVIVFFHDGVNFVVGEEIIQNTIQSLALPQKFNGVVLTELCGDDLSESNWMHIAKAKKVKTESVLDNIVTVAADIGEHLLPPEEYQAMFANECEEQKVNAPLYVLED